MIHLIFSYWLLLLPLAIALGAIPFWKARKEDGAWYYVVFFFWAGFSLAAFLIVLACMVGYYLASA